MADQFEPLPRRYKDVPDIEYRSYGVTYDGTQDNNFLNRNYFQLSIPRIPNFERFVQSVTVPQFSFSELTQPTTLGLAPAFPGSGYEFSPLVIGYAVDERFLNYQELYRWMESMAFLTNERSLNNRRESTSDITLSIKNSAYRETHRLVFVDAFPLILSPIEFTSLEPITAPITGTVTFGYSHFELHEVEV